MYLIKKVSEISGVSVRTLHYYDNIGLLPAKKNENGYRYYSEDDISFLQMILFYKYLGFSLKQIKELLQHEESEILSHLKKQLTLMQKEKQRLLTLIDTLKKTIEFSERRVAMPTKEKFNGFTFEDNQKYKQAAIDIYGEEIIEQSFKKQEGKEQEVTDEFNNIFSDFYENMLNGLSVGSKENIELARKLHAHICKYSFDCKIDVFSSIGYGYVKNIEFKNNLDRFGAGTAQYVCDAIQQYVKEKQM